MPRILYAFAFTSLALGAAGSASAHHSYAMFDAAKTVVLTGTVSKWSWTNPHSFLEMVVPSAGGQQNWAIESSSPSMLSRIGMTRKTMSPGDKVTVKVHPRRDGTHSGNLMSVELPNGSTISMGIPRVGADAPPN